MCQHYFLGDERTHNAKCRPEDLEVYKCEKCKYTTFRPPDLRRHIMFFHNNPYKCELCDAEYKTKDKLSLHTEKHFNIHLKCSFCGKMLTTKKNKNRHEKEKHKLASMEYKYNIKSKHADGHKLGRPLLQCSQCDYKTTLRSNFKRHSDIHKKGIRKKKPDIYSCEYCSYQTKHSYHLKRHMRAKQHSQATVVTMIDKDLFCAIDE